MSTTVGIRTRRWETSSAFWSRSRSTLSTVVLNWKEFRELQLAFLRASTPDSEIPSDHAIVAAFYEASRRHGVGYLLSGINLRTEGIHVREWSQGHLDSRYISSVYREFTGKRLRSFPLIPVATLVRNIVLHRPRTVFLLDYLDYDKLATKRMLVERYGWEDYGGKHYESVYTRFYQGWILPHKFGYDKRRMHLSTLVCSGQMTRGAALEEITAPSYPPAWVEPDTAFVAKKLGICASNSPLSWRRPESAITIIPICKITGPLVAGWICFAFSSTGSIGSVELWAWPAAWFPG